MIDYYPYLLRAVQSGDSTDPEARREVYQRAWAIVTDQLRTRQPPVSENELRTLRSGFQAAIERIEREYAPPPRLEPQMRAPVVEPGDEAQYDEEPSPAEPVRSRRGLWVAAVVAVLVLGIGIGGYSVLTSVSEKPAATTAINHEAALREPLLRRKQTVQASTADLAPGVDGGSTDADLPLVFRRQRVFYRTTFPPGTIVVDKPQHFAYLVLPNSAALRYGIGVGETCAELAGLRKIATKAEWPQWTPPAGGGPMPGGPGNPLGARLMQLDDKASSIHGTNAPKAVGEDVKFGCVRLVNDDVADLYNRVALGASVVLR
jgi:lipoprotein-anchoring transpeptidase ErfK/SrfK